MPMNRPRTQPWLRYATEATRFRTVTVKGAGGKDFVHTVYGTPARVIESHSIVAPTLGYQITYCRHSIEEVAAHLRSTNALA